MITHTEELLVTLMDAQKSDDVDKMRKALDKAITFINEGVAEAVNGGTRDQRARRIFDALGYSEIADEGKQTTAMFVCAYLNQRMAQDKRTRCKTEYYEDLAGALDRDITVVQAIWREYRDVVGPDSHKRIAGNDKELSNQELLEGARQAFSQQGQRLLGKSDLQ